MVHTSKVEVKYGLSEAHRKTLSDLEAQAARKPLSDYQRGALAGLRHHAMGEDLERVKRLMSSQEKKA